jgi:hypothetical protein
MKFSHVLVANIENAIRGMRKSWDSGAKSDSYTNVFDQSFVIGPADLALAQRLLFAGSDHSKFMRQIFVGFDLTAPENWWKQFDTYKVGTTRNSSSQMHTLGKAPITVDMFAFDAPDSPDTVAYIELLNRLREEWIENGRRKPSQDWRRLVQHIGGAWLYDSTITLNYQVLRAIYFARRYHRLDEWHVFCDWIATLPYAAELITWEKTK